MQVKTCVATIKAAGPNEGTEEGVFEAIVAAYNVDSVGDRIVPGAFKKSLDAWKASGDPIPVLWAHKSDDPEYHIGHVLEAEERPEGLWVKAQIDIDDPASKSAKVYRLLKGRRVRNFSFAYDEIDARPVEKSGDGATKELHELALHEVGPCLIGANRRTSLLDVKSDPTAQAVTRKTWTKVDADGTPAPGQECEVCGEAGHIECFDDAKAALKSAEIKTSDVVAALKDGRALSKEHITALAGLLVDIAGKAEELGDVLDVLAGPESGEKATPAQPAESSASPAKDQPARPGTASVTAPADLHRLAFLEAELAVEDY